MWFGLTWSLELYQQTIARIWRQGQRSETVVVIHIIADKTIDEQILKVLNGKKLQNALFKAVRAKNMRGYEKLAADIVKGSIIDYRKACMNLRR